MRFYSNFPREMGKFRQLKANSIRDIINYTNKYNGLTDLYTSVYGYADWYGKRPIYNSAIIDKVYWDVDPYKTDKGTGEKVFIGDVAERSLNLSDKLIDDDISHWIVASGNGINIYGMTDDFPVAPDEKKNTLYAIQKHYDDDTINADTLHGDVARISRLIKSRNNKFTISDGVRFTVFVSRKDLENGKYIKRMEQNESNKNSFVKGSKRIDLAYWEEEAPQRFVDLGYDMYVETEGEIDMELFETDFWCVEQAFNSCKIDKRLNNIGTNRDRFLVLSYMFNTAYTSQEAITICRNEFTDNVFNSMITEGQLKNIYRNGVSFPSRFTLTKEGRCNDCDRC